MIPVALMLACVSLPVAAHDFYVANGLPLIRMDAGEVLNIAAVPNPGDPTMGTITVDGQTYMVYTLAGRTQAGPIYAVPL